MNEATSSKNGSIVYSYDKNGNQLTSSDGTTYTYDGFNQLMAVTFPDGNCMENEYDASGLRVSVFENGMISDFPVNLIDPSGNYYYSLDGGDYTWHPDTTKRLLLKLGTDIACFWRCNNILIKK